ncbi:MAG: Aminodeoxychorismate lyase, partial [uncultured Pseudonocardia sp.]
GRARFGQRHHRPRRRDDDPRHRRGAAPRGRRVRGGPPLRRAPVRLGRARRPVGPVGRERAAGVRPGRRAGRGGGAAGPGRGRRRHRPAGDHPRRAAHRRARPAARPPPDGHPGHGGVRPHPRPGRGEVPVLRGQHARHPPRARRRSGRGAARHARRTRAGGPDLGVLLRPWRAAAHPAAGRPRPRLDHPPARPRPDRSGRAEPGARRAGRPGRGVPRLHHARGAAGRGDRRAIAAGGPGHRGGGGGVHPVRRRAAGV